MLKVTCYNSLCQLLEILFLSWYIRGMTVLCVLVIILASHIYTLGYLLGYLPSKASPLVLLFLSLGVLLLCFLPLLVLEYMDRGYVVTYGQRLGGHVSLISHPYGDSSAAYLGTTILTILLFTITSINTT